MREIITDITPEHITVREAAGILGVTEASFRQMMMRHRFKKIYEGPPGRRIYLSLAEIAQYRSKSTKLRAFEDLSEAARQQTFISLQEAADKLRISKTYIRRLVREGKIRAFITTEGLIMVPDASVEQYVRIAHHDETADL